jgi:glutamyl-Q tRNA(Asp) synthetase
MRLPASGRFAPSPTGPLHMGSLVTALASWLDARTNGYHWYLRIEDLDPPREDKGASELIKAQLQAHGLTWDYWQRTEADEQGVLFQHKRHAAYEEALKKLIAAGFAYSCCCSRKKLQYAIDLGKTRYNPDGEIIYPGYCRPKDMNPVVAEQADTAFEFTEVPGTSWRFRNDNGDDFVVRRADGYWAYHLAAVVDDAYQGITHVIRGDDLLEAAPRHTALRAALGFAQPTLRHVPIVKNDQGEKLSKQTLAPALRIDDPEKIRMQLEFAWSHLELMMNPRWVARVRPTWERLIRQRRD